MGDTNQELLRSWLTKATSDLRSAKVLASAEDPVLDTAIYHCQQAAEKAVKAFLVHCGVTPEKTPMTFAISPCKPPRTNRASMNC